MVNAQEYINQNYPKSNRNNITEINISQKNLTGSLNLQDFPNLEILLCPKNELTEIEISRCSKLKFLDCWNNKLKALDLTSNHQLHGLVCSDNQLTSLKIGNNQNLTYLDCSHNQLTSLNSVNNAPLLADLKCHGNQLENINNYSFPQLAKEKFIWTNSAQQWLDWLYSAEKKNEVNKLSISSKQLEGSLKIEGFANLEELDFPWNGFFGNGISELVVNQCPKLKKINCRWSGDSLSRLTVDNLENLENLNCAKNQLTELNINNCPNLEVLDCSSNKLTKLDLSNLKQLKELDIRNNNFSEQDLTFLESLNIGEDNIKQQNANPPYEVVIFLCHGLGSSASWFQSSTEQLQRELPYNVKLILPQAPTIKVDFVAIAGAKISPWRPSWYNIISFEDVRSGNNDHGLLTSVAQINKIIDQEIAQGIKPENIIIAGLSQGGSLALAIGLTSKQNLGGVIGWAAFTPYQKVLQERLTDISRKIPFLLMHDCIDRIVEYKVAQEAKDFLQENGYSLQFQNYFGAGHDHKLMMNDTLNFLKKQLANRSLLEKNNTEQANIEIVEIKEQEAVETKIEVPPK